MSRFALLRWEQSYLQVSHLTSNPLWYNFLCSDIKIHILIFFPRHFCIVAKGRGCHAKFR